MRYVKDGKIQEEKIGFSFEHIYEKYATTIMMRLLYATSFRFVANVFANPGTDGLLVRILYNSTARGGSLLDPFTTSDF